ncbi:MAG: glutathione S-transferase family protein [Steroidobacteraceae bacterium]
MKLYTSPLSSNARRAVLAALELGSDVELINVDLAARQQRQPGFLHRNPNGKVPVLEDGDFTLWESYAIMQYLADRTPGQTLYPTDARGRADVNRWMYWCAAQFSVGVAALNWENFVKSLIGLGAPDPGRVQLGEAQVRECIQVLDAHLAQRSYLLGDLFTLADLALVAPFMHEKSAQLPVGDAKHVRRWLAHVQARDSWQKTEPERIK